MTIGEDTIIARDPVTFEVVRSALYAICGEMKSVIMRTSFSPLLSLSADLSCAMLDAEGAVVGQGNDIPVHLGAVPFTVRAAFTETCCPMSADRTAISGATCATISATAGIC